MAWTVSLSVAASNTSIGSATAVFTDTDNTIFTFSETAALTAADATAFVTAAIAARNAWQARKTQETNGLTTLVNDFTTAGETATAIKAT